MSVKFALHVLMFIDEFYPGGAQRVAVDLCRAAEKSTELKISIAVSKNIGPLKSDLPENVICHEVGVYRSWRNAKFLANKLSNICHANGVDVIVSHMTHLNKAIARAKFLNKSLPPVVAVEHTEISRQFITARNPWQRFIRPREMKILYKNFDRIVVVSDRIAEELEAYCDVGRHKVVTIHNPLDINRVPRSGKSKNILQNDKGKTVISVGRFDAVKNFPLLISAFSLARKLRGHHNDRLLLVGDGGISTELKKYAHDLGVSDQVVFCGYKRDVFSYLRSSDVFVSTSLYEGLGNAMLEAIACDCPCIATKTAGSAELAKYVDGLALVDQGDEQGLSRKIYEQLEKPSLCVSERDRAFILRLAPHKILQQYTTLLREVVSK